MSKKLPAETRELESNKPAPVQEAERAVRRYGLVLASAGGLVSLWYWMVLLQTGMFIAPVSWWAAFLVGLVVIFFFPPTRNARRSRELLSRWDSLEIESRLEAAGTPTDSRLRVAEEMAKRIREHPSTDEAVLRTTSELIHHLRVTLHDIRTIQLTRDAGAAGLVAEQLASSLADTLDFVEARAGELLSGLEELHRAVVLRDASELSRVREEADEILHRLSAEREVERFLSPSPGAEDPA